MAKEPVAGRVKTRLGREIGPARATAAYRHMFSALLAQAGRDQRWTTIAAITPDDALGRMSLPSTVKRAGQGAGNLGERLERQFKSTPPGPVVIVGTDVPGVSRAAIARAFLKLGSHDAVIGPSPDGGYWLIGLSARARGSISLAGVRWSSPHARADTLRCLGGRTVAHLEEKSDVDCANDFARLSRGIGRRVIG